MQYFAHVKKIKSSNILLENNNYILKNYIFNIKYTISNINFLTCVKFTRWKNFLFLFAD